MPLRDVVQIGFGGLNPFVVRPRQSQSLFLNLFPQEQMHDILFHVGKEDVKDLTRVRLVCRDLCQIVQHENLWGRLYYYSFLPRYLAQNAPMRFNQAYQNVYSYRSNIINGLYKSASFSTPQSNQWACSMLVCDGKLITGTFDPAIRIYCMETGKCLKTITEHPDEMAALTVVDEKLFSFYLNQTVKTWDMTTGNCLNTFNENAPACEKLIVVDGSFFSGFQDGRIEVRAIETGKCLGAFVGHTSKICSLAVYNGNLISGSLNGIIKIWDLETRECLRTLQAPEKSGSVQSFAFFNGILFSIFSNDNKIWSWDIHTGNLLLLFEGQEEYVNSIAVIDDKLISFSDPEDDVLKIWEIKTGKCLSTFRPHLGLIASIDVIDEKLFLSTADGIIQFWDFIIEDKDVLREIAVMLKLDITLNETDPSEINDEMSEDDFDLADGGCFAEAEDRFSRMPRKIREQIIPSAQSPSSHPMVRATQLANAIDSYLSSEPAVEEQEMDRTQCGIGPDSDQWTDGLGPYKKQKKDL